jgi:Mn-dependent DtxR family transcriptional regulator
MFLEIIDKLREGSYPSKIAKKLGLSKQSMNKYIRELKKASVITKTGYGVWTVNEDNVKKFAKKTVKKVDVKLHDDKGYKPDTVRGHGFQFTLNLPKKLAQEDRRKLLNKNNVPWEKTGTPTWQGEKFFMNSWTCWLTPNTIVSWFSKDKSIYTSDASESFGEALHLWREQVIKPLERIFGRSFQQRTPRGLIGYDFKTGAEHYALIKNAVARELRYKKQKLYVYDKEGKLWLITDFSLSEDELETLKKGEAVSDNQKVMNLFNSVKDTGMTFHDVIKGFDMTKDQLSELMKDRIEYAENIKSHVNAIKILGSGINKFNNIISTVFGNRKKIRKAKERVEDKKKNSNLKNWL